MVRIFSLMKLRLEYQMLVAIVLALTAGVFFPDFAAGSEILGTVYLNLLKFIIGPLLFFSIISSIIGIGAIKEIGKVGGVTLALYMLTTLLAIIVSLVMMNLVTPGAGVDLAVQNFTVQNIESVTLNGFLISLIPKNIIAPFLEGNMMQLVFISILFAIAILAIADREGAKRLHQSSQTITEVVLKFTGWIIALTPIGVFGLIASLTAKNGLAPLLELWRFVAVVLGSLAFHLFFTLPLVAYLIGKINIYTYLFKLRNVILFAFSTASSSATLPLNLTETVAKGGVHKRIAELVLPIGATVNMDGTALYQAAVALFVAQGLGIDLTLSQQLTIALTVVLASVGASGIPGAGIVMLTTVFASIGLPMEAVGIIMLVDRFLDMFRTAVNVSGDIVVTKIVNDIYEKDLQKGE